MKAQSRDYIALQTLYRHKSQRDIAEITSTIRTLERNLNRQIPIETKEIEAFCKGAASIKLVRGKKLLLDPLTKGWNNNNNKDDYNNNNTLATIASHTSSTNPLTGKPSLFPILIALYALDSSTSSTTTTSPPSNPPQPLNLTPYITSVFSLLPQSPELTTALSHTLSIAKEIQRSGPTGGELHNISSLTGGMVAQEVIKVITRQYVPVDNCCVFDGVGSESGWFRI